MIRIQYTSIENPLLKDIPVHVYQTYPNKLDGEYQDYGLADIHYTRKTTPEGVSYDFIRIKLPKGQSTDLTNGKFKTENLQHVAQCRPWLRDRIALLNGKLKALGLRQVIVDDDGKIDGVLPKQPSMRSERNPHTNTVQQPKQVQRPAPKPVRKKYLVCYTTNTDHDSCKVWVYADSPEDAKERAYSEYWDIDYIDFVREL